MQYFSAVQRELWICQKGGVLGEVLGNEKERGKEWERHG